MKTNKPLLLLEFLKRSRDFSARKIYSWFCTTHCRQSVSKFFVSVSFKIITDTVNDIFTWTRQCIEFLINFGDYPKFTMVSERLTSYFFVSSPSMQKTVDYLRKTASSAYLFEHNENENYCWNKVGYLQVFSSIHSNIRNLLQKTVSFLNKLKFKSFENQIKYKMKDLYKLFILIHIIIKRVLFKFYKA